MKKASVSLSVLMIVLLVFPVCSMAQLITSNQEYKQIALSEINAFIDIPSDYYVMMRGMSVDDPALSAIGIDYNSALAFLTSNNTHFIAFNESVDKEFSLSSKESTLSDFSKMEDYFLLALADRTSTSYSMMGYTILKIRIYEHNGMKYVKFTGKDNESTGFIEYITVISGIEYDFDFYFYSSDILSSDQESESDRIIDSFRLADTSTEYLLYDLGMHISVPGSFTTVVRNQGESSLNGSKTMYLYAQDEISGFFMNIEFATQSDSLIELNSLDSDSLVNLTQAFTQVFESIGSTVIKTQACQYNNNRFISFCMTNSNVPDKLQIVYLTILDGREIIIYFYPLKQGDAISAEDEITIQNIMNSVYFDDYMFYRTNDDIPTKNEAEYTSQYVEKYDMTVAVSDRYICLMPNMSPNDPVILRNHININYVDSIFAAVPSTQFYILDKETIDFELFISVDDTFYPDFHTIPLDTIRQGAACFWVPMNENADRITSDICIYEHPQTYFVAHECRYNDGYDDVVSWHLFCTEGGKLYQLSFKFYNTEFGADQENQIIEVLSGITFYQTDNRDLMFTPSNCTVTKLDLGSYKSWISTYTLPSLGISLSIPDYFVVLHVDRKENDAYLNIVEIPYSESLFALQNSGFGLFAYQYSGSKNIIVMKIADQAIDFSGCTESMLYQIGEMMTREYSNMGYLNVEVSVFNTDNLPFLKCSLLSYDTGYKLYTLNYITRIDGYLYTVSFTDTVPISNEFEEIADQTVETFVVLGQ